MAKYQRRELLRGEDPGHGLKTVQLQNVISSHLGMSLPTLHSLEKMYEFTLQQYCYQCYNAYSIYIIAVL